jgi:hypothetical protein
MELYDLSSLETAPYLMGAGSYIFMDPKSRCPIFSPPVRAKAGIYRA